MFNIETETRLIMEIVEREPFEATFGIVHSEADYEALTSAINNADADAYAFDEGIYFFIMAYKGETIENVEPKQDLWTFAPKEGDVDITDYQCPECGATDNLPAHSCCDYCILKFFTGDVSEPDLTNIDPR